MRRIKVVKLTAKNCFDKSRYGMAWEKIKEVVPLSGRRCSECGSNKKLERDHFTPVSKGGRHSISNVQILCQGCHDKKHPHRKKFRKQC
jgi:5-methylcytosine-specific restriction endonuclease McrA